jgi:hypothetical protein
MTPCSLVDINVSEQPTAQPGTVFDVRFREVVRDETEIETLDSTVQRECLDMVKILVS